jgi:lipoprotein signal peptidase
MFVPIIGPILGFFILFDTGYALGAIAQVQGVPALLEILVLILTPVFWLEFTSYSIGITESIWLFRRLMQRRWRELRNTVILVGVCAGLLAVGAVVETWLISIGV